MNVKIVIIISVLLLIALILHIYIIKVILKDM